MENNIIILGQSEKYNGYSLGQYEIDVDIIADIDSVMESKEELEVILGKENISLTTFKILKKVIEELETYAEV